VAVQGLEVAVELCANEARVGRLHLSDQRSVAVAGKPPLTGSLIVTTA
jgi:hypothetical protein